MKSFEEFKMEYEIDKDFQSIFKRLKELEINALNYKNVEENKQIVLRYEDEGKAFIEMFAKENSLLESELIKHMKPPGAKAVYEPVWNSYQNLVRSVTEALKAYARANALSYQLVASSQYALELGFTKGWEKYVNDQIEQEIKDIEHTLALLKTKVYGRVKL